MLNYLIYGLKTEGRQHLSKFNTYPRLAVVFVVRQLNVLIYFIILYIYDGDSLTFVQIWEETM